MVTGRFLIGDAIIQIDGDEKMSHPENLELFRINDVNGCACHYKIQGGDDFSKLIEQLKAKRTSSIVTREDLTVFQTNTGECRIMNFKGADWQYAASLQTSANQCEIWFLRQVQSQLFLDTIFWAPFCLKNS